MNKLEIGDILRFRKYYFNDTGADGGARFALLILPIEVTEAEQGFSNQAYCSVITKQKPYNHYSFLVKKESYSCFTEEKSYICLDRRDFQSFSDLENGKQPKGELSKEDARKVYKTLKNHIKDNPKVDNQYLIATLIREWKKKIS